MKPLFAVITGMLAGAMLLGACSGLQNRAGRQAPDAPELAPTPASGGAGSMGDAGVAIEKIPFRLGVSSATVEKMARQQACRGGQGAGLITQPGPVEVYRMQCDDGKVFMARCELRQCRKM